MALYYVYYAIQKNGKPKVGASSNPNERKRSCKYQEIILLEEFDCAIKCGDREIELQQQYFGKRDSSAHYASMINKCKGYKHTKEAKENMRLANADKSYFQTEEYKTKMSESTKRRWENERELMMKTTARGSNIVSSKLTDENVRFIRKVYYSTANKHTPIPHGKMSRKQLEDKFNCTGITILKVVNKKSWKHVI